MVSRTSDWRDELGRWLKPFLDRLGHKARRQMCPLYVSGLIGPGDRKSVQPMAAAAARCGASSSITTSLSKKSLHAAEQERADVARARQRWMREQGMFDPAHLVFVDETAA